MFASTAGRPPCRCLSNDACVANVSHTGVIRLGMKLNFSCCIRARIVGYGRELDPVAQW